MDADGSEDPVVEADGVDRERKAGAAAARRPQFWSWNRLSAVVIVGLVVLLILAVAPVRNVSETGVVWHGLTTSNQYYLLESDQLTPAPSRCEQATLVCTDLWVAFNWSTTTGHLMTFDFLGIGGVPAGNVLLYSSENMSYGGYSFYCGAPPLGCGDTFQIDTNDTSGQSWTFDWEMVYNYTATVPFL